MKKTMKKLICAACALTLSLGAISSVSAHQSDSPAFIAVSKDPARISSSELISAYSQNISGDAQNQEMIEKIVDGISNFEETITIANSEIPFEEVKGIMDYIRYEYPELIQYSGGFGCSYSYNSSTGDMTKVKPDYIFTKAESDNYIPQFNVAMDEIVADAEKYDDDFKRALYVHDYLATHCEYATKALNSGANMPEVYTAYGCLVGKRAVCQGYSMAYKAILKRLSIPCGFASSETMNHIWNVITVGGKSYHTDVTFDDPIADLRGRVEHSSFLCTDAEISIDHENWTTNMEVSDVSYEGRFWDKIESNIIISGDDMIYAAYDPDSKRAYLARRNYKTNEVSKIPSSLDDARWYVLNSNIYYYLGNYSRLELVGDRIYYSLPTGVNSIGLDGSGNERVYTLNDTSNGYIYGFVGDGEKFYAELRADAAGSGTIIELPIEYPFVPMLGDIDGNGEISIADAIMVQKHIVGIITLEGDVFRLADVDKNGAISISDAIMIQKHIVGILSIA